MQKKTVAMMAVMGCAAAMLSGCGIKQEVYDAKVTELDAAWLEIKGLKGQIEDGKALLDNKKKELRTAVQAAEIEADKLKDAKTKEAATASALAAEKTTVSGLERKLSSAKSSADRARKDADKAEGDLETLQGAYAVLNARWKQFEDNLSALDKAVGSKGGSPVAVQEEAGVAPKAKSAMELMNEL